jgi:EAL domain-containing protein (putative c-di-GMP-specific phosphodiesterase class I)
MGVESGSHLNYLEGLDCQIMPGFLLSKPLPVTDFLNIVTAQHEKLFTLANA